jgi:hypothetical protein
MTAAYWMAGGRKETEAHAHVHVPLSCLRLWIGPAGAVADFQDKHDIALDRIANEVRRDNGQLAPIMADRTSSA